MMAQQMQTNVPPLQFSEAQMKRYFSTGSARSIMIVIVGVLLVIVGIYLNFLILSGVGALLIIAGGIVIMVARSRPSDKEFDRWLEGQSNALAAAALEKLHLHPNQVLGPPLHLHGYVLPGTKDARNYDEIRQKQGKDGQWRFSANVYTFFFPADHHIAVFSSGIDALDQSAHVEQAYHYFYHDIVGVAAQDVQDTINFKGRDYTVLLQQFSLKVANGDAIGIGGSFSVKPIGKKKDAVPFAVTDSDVSRTVAALLALLRDMKRRNP